MTSCAEMNISAQDYCDYRYDYVWIMGGIDIDTTSTDVYGGFEINFNSTPMSILPHPKFVENPLQNASMSNKNGELQFYSNGCQIIGDDNVVLINGDSLNSSDINYGVFCPELGYRGRQDMISLPDVVGDSILYLFYISQLFLPNPDKPIILFSQRLNYARILFSEKNPSGIVLIKNEPIYFDTSMIGTPVTATKHANGRDWWIITPNRWSNSFNIVFLGEDGPIFLGRQYIGDVPHYYAEGGQGKFSPDGRHFAWFHPLNGLFFYNFDRTSGVLSNFRKIVTPASDDIVGGCEFSPSGRYVYFNTLAELYQIDTWEEDIQSTLTLIDTYDGFADPFPTGFHYQERTPDHRIFMNVTNGSQWLHIIQEPDKKGQACRFEQHTLKFPFVNNFTLPHFPNYRLGALEDPLCDSVMVAVPHPSGSKSYEFIISPNPSTDQLSVYTSDPDIAGELHMVLTDLYGHTVHKENTLLMDVSGIPPGFYLIRIYHNESLLDLQKVVIQH